MSVTKYTFSGHESFTCKTLWLKKGYDFIRNNNNFNSPDSVVELGVGKNMVASIRYWMRAFGLTENDGPIIFLIPPKAKTPISRTLARYGSCTSSL